MRHDSSLPAAVATWQGAATLQGKGAGFFSACADEHMPVLLRPSGTRAGGDVAEPAAVGGAGGAHHSCWLAAGLMYVAAR